MSVFKDRSDAGKQLAQKLARYAGEDVVVLALPRGGVVVGYEVARELKAPLDISAVRKIGFPSEPEYAVGAVADDGTTLLNEEETKLLGKKLLQAEIDKEQKEAARRGSTYRKGGAPLPLTGKTVIIVDDGIATGLTMRLAVRSAKAQQPKRVIAAAPVAPAEAVTSIRDEGVDELVTLEPPEKFESAIGAHYDRFEQVDDAEVIRLLHYQQPL